MRNDNCFQTANGFDLGVVREEANGKEGKGAVAELLKRKVGPYLFNRACIQERNAVPEDVAAPCAEEEGSLADSELWVCKSESAW